MHDREIVDLFDKDGFLHLRSFVSVADCERLKWRMKSLAEKRGHNDRSKVFLSGSQQSQDDFFLSSSSKIAFFFDKNAQLNTRASDFRSLNKVGHALHRLCPVFGKFSHQPRFYELMKILGQKRPLPVQSMFIFKQSHFGDEVPAHQDATFLYTEPNSVIGLWIALEDADETNGCLWVLPKKHHGPLKHRFVKTTGGLQFADQQRVDWPRKNFIPLVAKMGDVVVLHGLLPHLSEQNRSHKTRFAYTLHFIDHRCYFPKTNWLDITKN